jgi:hypothetical protein
MSGFHCFTDGHLKTANVFERGLGCIIANVIQWHSTATIKNILRRNFLHDCVCTCHRLVCLWKTYADQVTGVRACGMLQLHMLLLFIQEAMESIVWYMCGLIDWYG